MVKCKTWLVLLFLMLLACSLIVFEVSPEASANPMAMDDFFGEKAPPGITINDDGSVDGTSSIVQLDDGTFIFTGDVSGSITILKKGATLDGKGHALRGRSDQIGIFMKAPDGVTITNLKIEGFAHGIRLAWLHYGDTDGRTITVTGNTFRGNINAISSSDHLQGSSITDNSFIDNTYCIAGFEGINVKNNVFLDNQHCLAITDGINNVDTSNLVNEKPLYYWVGQQNRAVPSNAGSVFLKDCKNITVQGLNITRAGGEVQLYNTNHSTVKGNSLSKSGITLYKSSWNLIEDNKILGCKNDGVYLRFSGENRIVKNQISGNQQGVHLEFCNNITLSQNELSYNSVAGLNMSYQHQYNNSASTTLVNQNVISNNGVGIQLYSSDEATIVANNIVDNLEWGMVLDANPKNNSIHHNNFIGNNINTGKLQVCITGFWMTVDNGSSVDGKYTPPRRDFVPGEANCWCNGLEGNYYSEYMQRYPNATEVGGTGVGDTPYYINPNNIDQHPLMAPIEITNTNHFTNPLTSNNETPIAPATESDATLPSSNLLIILLAITSVSIVGLVLAFWKRKD
jgi:parallel beta-helix repeat protein